MAHTIEQLKARIHMLEERDPVKNRNIIAKLTRKLRRLEEEK